MKLVEMVHGSRLYGTHSETSDYDYKGVALPSVTQILTGNIPKVIERTDVKKAEGEKNKAGDVEGEIYSLHYFIDLCLQGQTVALDMLHAPRAVWAGSDGWNIWEELVSNKHRFYTRKMTALVGYARHQAAKYGIKGSRLAAVKKVYNCIRDNTAVAVDVNKDIAHMMAYLPLGEHIHVHEPSPEHNNIGMYEVCGIKMQFTAKAAHYLGTLQKFIDNYGERARMAESNQGIDWKAVSHAFRAAFQTRHIFLSGGFTYPLPETRYLKDIKAGEVPYSIAGPELEKLIDEVEVLATVSELPDAPDKEWAQSFLERVTKEYLLDSWGLDGDSGNLYPANDPWYDQRK